MSFAFANTILVPWEEGQIPALRTIGAVDQPRKRRTHHKSRHGCLVCKQRRVKCDERVPCSSCVRRNIQCVQPQPPRPQTMPPSVSPISAHFNSKINQINFLHLELFNHWDKHTRATLTFPCVWPFVMQRAFNEEFIMSAILCISAFHLATLCPGHARYAHASLILMAKTVFLFRKNLLRPLTKNHCEALVGTGLLMNYILWCDLGFLSIDSEVVTPANPKPRSRLNLAHDQLFLTSAGIVQIWLQAVPIFINEESVFTQVIFKNPRRDIEEALRGQGQDPTRFVEPFMKVWDDPQFQAITSDTLASETETGFRPPSYSWLLLSGLDTELSLSCLHSFTSAKASNYDETQKLLHVRDAFIRVTTNVTSHDYDYEYPQSLARSSFENVVRRMSPLLCCAAGASESTSPSSSSIHTNNKPMPREADIERLFYGFPIFCCGPFATSMMRGESRALVFLYHFYRTARILLPPGRCWWASVRSRFMEELILEELNGQGLDGCLPLSL
ncbi:hypothetical protein BJY01DRAFT_201362 [Aspergillus pseudoustus]|uniref:Zn(2)-C6 fungal-type domain-containing protein n=1 Tax=Aspergillus pseudoustus TaxID=1810923 RepID=A0ABR4L341_9EURO